MAGIVIIINLSLSKILFGSMIKNIVRMLIGALFGVVTYFIVTMILKVNELKSILKNK